MSLRIGLYDFFSYTLPGALFIVLTAVGLTAFGVIDLDITILNDLSLVSLLVLVGAGYIVGLLLNPLAERWVRPFIGSHHRARDEAFEDFHRRHPKLKIEFAVYEWEMLLYGIKVKSTETAMDVELHNVISIMLRIISLILMIGAVLFLLIFIFIYTNIFNLVIAIAMLFLSRVAIGVCRLRRRWFYKGIFEAFAAYYLLEEKIKNPEAPSPTENVPTVASVAANDA